MISESVKSFVEGGGYAYIASSDSSGAPHLASGSHLSIPDPDHLLFEAWFCTTTLRNVGENPKVAVAVADPASRSCYLFLGRVEKGEQTALLDAFLPQEQPGLPQVETRLSVLVEGVMDFTVGAHSDQLL